MNITCINVIDLINYKLVIGFDPGPEWTLEFYFTHASRTRSFFDLVAYEWAIPIESNYCLSSGNNGRETGGIPK